MDYWLSKERLLSCIKRNKGVLNVFPSDNLCLNDLLPSPSESGILKEVIKLITLHKYAIVHISDE